MRLRSRLWQSLLLVSVALPALAQQDVQIKGSDTLIFLGQRVSSFYRRGSGEFSIGVLGGGASAPASSSQIVQWEGVGSKSTSDVLTFPVGIQALVVYVHRSNPVHDLTISQLRKIFLGQITNWKELGGADATILLYAGESTTGNLPFFQDAILGGEEPYPFVGKANTMDLLAEIAHNPAAIGYGSLGINPDVRSVRLKTGPASLPVEPTSENIRSRVYPITRYIHWRISRDASVSVVALCHWMLSSDGQLAIESAGFAPLLPNDRTAGLNRLESAKSQVIPVGFRH